MPVVWIPALMRDLTGGQERLEVPGATVQELIENLDRRCPGIQGRLMVDGALRPGINVIVDGVVSRKRLRHRLAEFSEVHFLPAISGGRA